MTVAKSHRSYLAVARAGETLFVRAHGACTASLCPALQDLTDLLLAREGEAAAGDRSLEAGERGDADELGGPCRSVVIDLSEATGLDSTFMGMLLGIAEVLHRLRVRAPRASAEAVDLLSEAYGGKSATATNDAAGLVIANASEHCRRQMEMLGLTRLLDVPAEPMRLPDFEMTTLAGRPLPQSEHLRLVRNAHERLVAADVRNQAKFQALLDALARERDDRQER